MPSKVGREWWQEYGRERKRRTQEQEVDIGIGRQRGRERKGTEQILDIKKLWSQKKKNFVFHPCMCITLLVY